MNYCDFTIVNTNARSLCPKINSLLDCFEELDVGLSIVTETWLSDGPTLVDDAQDLLLGAGIGILYKNRPVGARGISHGGVAVLYRESDCSFKEMKVQNPLGFEVLPVVGNVVGQKRRMVVIACYIPPNYTVNRAKQCMDYIASLVIEAKRRVKDPYIVVSGDFNQWQIAEYLEDFRDVHEISRSIEGYS